MTDLNEHEIWRQIPPEEKFELMARAHADGVVAAIIVIIICSTIAVGLKLSWVMWGSIIMSPFIFQFAAGKKWRDLKPRIMLEYLAARSAARRFAFASRGQDLTLNFIFRGRIEQKFSDDLIQEALEAMIDNTKEAEVWVALFGDSLVMMQEHVGGAMMKFGHVLDEKIEIKGISTDDKGDYSSKREVMINLTTKDKKSFQYKLTSRYPAALVVFEKKAKVLKEAKLKAISYDPAEVGILSDDSLISDNEVFGL